MIKEIQGSRFGRNNGHYKELIKFYSSSNLSGNFKVEQNRSFCLLVERSRGTNYYIKLMNKYKIYNIETVKEEDTLVMTIMIDNIFLF